MSVIEHVGIWRGKKEPERLPWDYFKEMDWILGAEILPWGTRVQTHHLASVLRGGSPSKESLAPLVRQDNPFLTWGDAEFGNMRSDYKTIWIWPAEFDAIVLGTCRKGIGYLYQGSGKGAFGDEYEPPGFTPMAFVPLYILAIEHAPRVYAPIWGVHAD